MARFLSYLFHPLIITMAGAIILLRAVNWMGMLPMDTRLYIYLVFFISTLLLPLAILAILKSKNIISDFFMPTPEERKIPLLLSSFLYLAGAFVLQKIHTPLIFPLFLNSSSVVILLCALFSWKWKISYHMASIGGLIGLVMAISLKWMFDFRLILGALIFISGVIAWARLKEDSHTPAQVYAGFGLGFTIIFLIIRFI